MQCSACGHVAPDGGRFCPSCGRSLLTTASDVTVAVSEADATRLSSTDATIAPLSAAHHAINPENSSPIAIASSAFSDVDDLRLNHQVALKFLPPALATDKRRLDQFHNEVRIARQVSHPNVCRVYDIGESRGELFLSMEYVEGEDLAAALERVGKYSEADAVELARQICAGVAAAHDKGVLHRDVKPDQHHDLVFAHTLRLARLGRYAELVHASRSSTSHQFLKCHHERVIQSECRECHDL